MRMKKLVSGLAIVLVSAGLAACGSPANDAGGNTVISNETVLDDEIPADDNLTVTDNGLVGNDLDLGNDIATNAL
jgi:hypothetical protein